MTQLSVCYDSRACRYNARMFSPLSPERIAALCRPAAQAVSVRVVEETGSTNADLLAALPGLSAPTLLIAKNQTAGRGRAGRNWYSAAGHSLTFSLAWKFHLPVQSLIGLPLAVGVALAEALAMFNIEVALKWPNDVLYNGKKLAGVLIESATGSEMPHAASWAVIGVGINMRLEERALAEIGSPAIGIAWLADLEQEMLFATLASSLSEALVRFEQEGLAAFVDRWNRLHAFRGQEVRILDNGRTLHEGVAIGVDDIGRFLLESRTGQVTVMAGDVSLRPREA